jgi:hypothetical protein
MIINIIHLPERLDRWLTLQKELEEQGITEYKIWDGIIDDGHNTTRAISRAHKQIIQFAKEIGLPEVMIAEDDVQFISPGAFNYFLENKPPDFDIYLASVYHGIIKEDSSVTDFSGLTLYIVKSKFYDQFLAVNENEDLDRALKNKGKFIICNPFAAIQYNGYSDHLKKYCNYDWYLRERKLFGLN